MPHSTYVAVDTEALGQNLRTVRTRLAERVRLMAVVKANGYGHGLELSARTFAAAGADWLGVSSLAEGIALREAGLALPVLVFLPVLAADVEELVRHRLTGTVVSRDEIPVYAQATRRLGQAADVHIYVDTGLGRLGSDDSLPDILAAAEPYSAVNVTGVYTHFGPPGSGTLLEGIDTLRPGASVKAFASLANDALSRAGAGRICIHCAASELTLNDPAAHLDMVRVGTLLYGQMPADVGDVGIRLRQTFELRSHIVAVQTLPPGSPVGYGGQFVTRRETRVATVPVGLAHGLGQMPESLLRNWRLVVADFARRRAARRGRAERGPWAMLGDKRVPIIGRISMDQCCLDVTDTDAAVGDCVVLDTRRVSTSAAIPRVATSIEQ
ncbi:MAG TPA: alanine racemase [Armatimonadetes bacterium]|jgi:alanine racemase|nr:alanine racemase [Armatimonadota bacterium]